MTEHPYRILVVEDHEPTRDMLRKLLGHGLAGWDVLVAGSVQEAMDQLGQFPDCVVLDLDLPDGRGEAILQAIRMRRLPTRVIVHSAMQDPSRMNAVSDLDPEAIIAKPLDSGGLLRVFETAAAGM